MPTAPLDLDEELETPGIAQPQWSGDEFVLINVDGRIWVRGGRFFGNRVVGRVRGEEGKAQIARLIERFEEMEKRWEGLEREISRSRNLVRNAKSLHSFFHWVENADAIGDFAALLEKVQHRIEETEAAIATRRNARKTLVDEAEKMMDSTHWRSTAEAFDLLMEEWKKAPSAGGEEDEALWQRFRSARQRFFHRRAEHSHQRSESIRAKKDLIEQARALAECTDWKRGFDQMQEMMEAWKKIPSVGKKKDDELWEEFRAARDPFFQARKAAAKKSAAARRQGGRSRTGGGGSGGLHASLAELVGPLRDLFPPDEK